MTRVELIVPVQWRGQTVTALTFDPLSEAKIAQILKLDRRILSDRRYCQKAVALAADVPASLVKCLFDRDLQRAAQSVTAMVRDASAALLIASACQAVAK